MKSSQFFVMLLFLLIVASSGISAIRNSGSMKIDPRICSSLVPCDLLSCTQFIYHSSSNHCCCILPP
ncbi:unnamed protein product [Amaranthus hypochondriacus]